jgi:rare lipoprotein A (peptidoglycan hydrolase)
MKLRPIYGIPVVALVLFSGAIPSRSRADQVALPSPPAARQSPAAAAATQLSEAPAQIGSYAEIASPPRKPPLPAGSVARRTVRATPATRVRGGMRTVARRLADTAHDEKPVQVKTVGLCQVGTAAWYGGHYVGQRTSNGERLDGIHATAAHRTLPLNSLVRVTNLHNGRSVIVRITDRGPVSERLAIDVSPKAAEQLAMKDAGVVPVSIEQVVEVPQTSR